MARLLVVSRSMALALRLADAHEVVELSVDDLGAMVPDPDIDAVVLDVGEPALAIQTLDRLRGSGDTTPLLIVSGYQPAWAGLAAVDIPGVVVVPLPITRTALLDGVDLLVPGGPASAPLPPGAVPRPPRPPRPRSVPPISSAPVIPPAPTLPPVTAPIVRPAPVIPSAPVVAPALAEGPDEILVDPPIQRVLPAEPVRVGGAGSRDARTAPVGPAADPPVPASSDDLLRPFIAPDLPEPRAATDNGWAGPDFDWWPHPAEAPTVEPPDDEPPDDEPPDDEPPPRPLRRGWPRVENVGGPVLLPVDPDGVLPLDPDAPSADDLFPPFTTRRPPQDTAPASPPVLAEDGPAWEAVAPPLPTALPTSPDGVTLPAAFSAPDTGSQEIATPPDDDPRALVEPSAAAGQQLVTRLVAQLTEHAGHLLGVSAAAQFVAEQAVLAGSATASALIVPDGGVWRVSGGVGLRPEEHQLVLHAGHWLIDQVGLAGRALALEDTEAVRRHLVGAPLAQCPYSLAVPVPAVRAVVLLGRGLEAGPFTGVELTALSDPLDAAAELLVSAVRTRHLARLLAPLQEVPPS